MNLPNVTGGALSTGTSGAWLARFDATLSTNTQSTWLAQPSSGSSPQVYGLRVHPANGDVYVLTVAHAASAMPANATANGGRPTCGGTFQCLLLLRMNTALTSVVAGTFYGSPDTAAIVPRATNHLFIDPVSGDAFVAADGGDGLPNISDAPKTFTIAITDDTAAESDEYFNLVLTGAVGATLGAQSTAVVTIADNDAAAPEPGTVQLSAVTYSGSENGGAVVLTLTRTNGSSGAVDVTVATGGGTATAGSDYTALNAVVSWADGDSADKTVNLVLLDDTLVEGSETIGVTLSGPAGGAALGAQSMATVTVTDNDTAPQPPPAQGGGGGGGAIDVGWLTLLAFGVLSSAAARRRRRLGARGRVIFGLAAD